MQYEVPGTEYRVLTTSPMASSFSMALGTRYSVLGTRYSVLGTRYSVRGTRYSVLGTYCSTTIKYLLASQNLSGDAIAISPFTCPFFGLPGLR